jgi:recombination protein RecR
MGATMISESVSHVIDELAKLPGIGKKSAERLTYHILRISDSEAFALADAIRGVKENVRHCEICCNLAEESVCSICQDPQRDRTTLCVVEQPRDLMALEQSGTYHGLYHVLLGRVAPLEGVGPEDLTIDIFVDGVNRGRRIRAEATPTDDLLSARVGESYDSWRDKVDGDGKPSQLANRLLFGVSGGIDAPGPKQIDRIVVRSGDMRADLTPQVIDAIGGETLEIRFPQVDTFGNCGPDYADPVSGLEQPPYPPVTLR